MWILRTDNGVEEAGQLTFRVLPGAVKTIGRGTIADFIVDAGLVSRIHCQVTATPGGLELQDLNSTNGTYVNGKRVKSTLLAPGDRLRVGRVELLVSEGEHRAPRGTAREMS